MKPYSCTCGNMVYFENTQCVRCSKELGVVFNELNRAMGLTDLVPEIIGPPIVTMMRYVHELVRTAARSIQASTQTTT